MPHRFARIVSRLRVLCLGLSVCGAGFSAGGAHASELRHTATVKLIQQARPAIVNIHGQKTLTPNDENFRPGEVQHVNGMGTGIIIDPRGYILTNHHVVDGVRKIEVNLADKTSYVASRVSHDSKTDLAVIKINAPQPLPVITIGTSSDLMIGEPVIAIGNAFGYSHTVTRGIISELHRTVQVSDSQNYNDLVQTDAAINPGNSGGPLMNIDGEMIAINVAVRQHAHGIGFAIPVDQAMNIAAELMSVGRLENTWHGIAIKPTTAANAGRCVVGRIDSSSPAAKCGLEPGDVITAVGDTNVARGLDLERALLGHQPGEEIAVTVERDKQPVSLNLVLSGTPKKSSEQDRIWETVGLRLEPVPPSQLKRYQKQYRGGLLVTDVRRDGPAAHEGIRKGDILLGMHIWETITLDNVSYVIKSPDFASQPLKFLILRNESTYYGDLSLSMRTK